jgi:hypothetical protein
MEIILTNFRREFKDNWQLTAIHLMVNHVFKILEIFVIQLRDYIAQLRMELILNMELIALHQITSHAIKITEPFAMIPIS